MVHTIHEEENRKGEEKQMKEINKMTFSQINIQIFLTQKNDGEFFLI